MFACRRQRALSFDTTRAFGPRNASDASQNPTSVVFPSSNPVVPAVRSIFRGFHLFKDASGYTVRRCSTLVLLRLDQEPRNFPGRFLASDEFFRSLPECPCGFPGDFLRPYLSLTLSILVILGAAKDLFPQIRNLRIFAAPPVPPLWDPLKQKENLSSKVLFLRSARSLHYSTAAHSLTNSSAMRVSSSSVFFSPARIVSSIFRTLFSGR